MSLTGAAASSQHRADVRLEAVIEEYGRFLRRTVAHLCPKNLGIQIDDIEQEARIRLWRALESEKDIRDLSSYVRRIAARVTIDAVRRVKARREEQLRPDEGENQCTPGLATGAGSSPECVAERRALVRKIQQALARLPERRRCAVALHLQGFTTQQIAGLLGWSEAKSRNLVYRGLDDLRKQLGGEGIGCGAEA